MEIQQLVNICTALFFGLCAVQTISRNEDWVKSYMGFSVFILWTFGPPTRADSALDITLGAVILSGIVLLGSSVQHRNWAMGMVLLVVIIPLIMELATCLILNTTPSMENPVGITFAKATVVVILASKLIRWGLNRLHHTT